MVSQIVGTRVWKSLAPDEIPDGDYPGIWGGYEVGFTIGVSTYKIPVKDGIRTMSAKCIVHVKNGKILVETLPE